MEAERVVATYRVTARATEIDAIAAAIAVEQSVEMPISAITQSYVLRDIVGEVQSVEPLDANAFSVGIGLSMDTIANDPAQLLNMAFGNCSLLSHIELVDLSLPSSLEQQLGGPRHGIDGLRQLVAVPDRALTCAALKPQGSSPEHLALLCETFARAGVDFIKDDHGLADQPAAPFHKRLEMCQAAVARANDATGLRCHYVPSLVGGPRALWRQGTIARDGGVRSVLIAPMLVGLAVLADFVTDFPELAVIAHPSFAGSNRIAPELLLGTLFRLYGADVSIFPCYGGRFSYDAARCTAISNAAREPLGGLRPMLPVAAGGMTPGRVGELVSFYGQDVMLLVGGALLAAPDGLGPASEKFVAAVNHASIAGTTK